MKIMHYYDRYKPLLGGVETHIENIVHIKEFNHEIITDAIPSLPIKEEIASNAVVHRFKPYDRTISPYKSKIKSRATFPYRVYSDIIRNKSKFDYLNNSDYDILHVHGPALSMNFLRVDKWLRTPLMTKGLRFDKIDKPKILTMHGLFSVFTSNPYAEKYEKRLVNMFDKVICVDDFILDKVKSYGIENPILIPNSIDIGKFKYIKPHKTNKLKLGFIGRIEDKVGGVNHIIELANSKPDWLDISIVGASSPKVIRDFESKIDTKNIRFIPNLSPEKIPEFFASIDIVYNPVSTGAITRVTLEAMACGRPVIMFGVDKKGPIINGETGFLIKDNYDDMSLLIKSIDKSDTNLESMGIKAREKIISEYSNEIIFPKVKKTYSSIMAERS